MATGTREGKFASLARLFKPGQVLTHPVELITYEQDAAIDRGHPDAVVFPQSREDIVQVLKWAHENHVPVVARGAGTGLSGGAVAEYGGLILEFSRMDRILDFDPAGRSVTFEMGVVNLRLDEFVKKAGLYFPPDPASGRSATLGGNIAENAGGPHCFKYGVTTNYLTGMEVVLADGRVVHLGGQALDYPEYDLLGLLTGSEGTLGMITQASARLLRNPPAVKTMMAAFNTVEQAGEAVSAIIAAGLVPATMEFMDQKMMGIIEDYAHAGLPVMAGAALIIEVDGYAESLSLQVEEIVTILREHNAWDLRVAQTAEERDRIWYGRKSAAGAMARLSPSYYLLDGTVPRSKLARTLAAVTGVCEDMELRVSYVFHAGDGNLHPFILIEDPNDAGLMERVYLAGQRIMEICIKQGGSLTGEHGVGIEKRKFMPLMYSEPELMAMREVKQVFDPENILNPGKVLPEAVSRGPEGHRHDGAVQGETAFTPVSGQLYTPASPEAAADLFRAALSGGQSVHIRGGGTKTALRSDGKHIVLCTRGLRGVCRVALEDLYVTVNAGTTLHELQAELAQFRMWVPLVSPWPESTVGGLISTNFNAPLRMRYGSVRDLLLAASVVLPDRRIIRAGRAVVKNVAGYDLPKLFVGAYGTLGLITDATLKLAPLPRARASLIAPVEDLDRGLELCSQLLPVCLVASALLLCKGCCELSPAPYALVYTAEGVAEDVAVELAQVRSMLQAGGLAGLQQVDEPTGSDAWAAWISLTASQDQAEKQAPLARLGLPARDLPGFLKGQAAALAGTEFMADLASGLLYIKGARDLPALRQSALRQGGYAIQPAATAVEEGIEPWGYLPESLELMRKLKAAWDPQSVCNPGAFIL